MVKKFIIMSSKDLLPEYKNLISFVPARTEDTGDGIEDTRYKHAKFNKLSGTEAKTFYENLLNDTSAKSTSQQIRKRKNVSNQIKSEKHGKKRAACAGFKEPNTKKKCQTHKNLTEFQNFEGKAPKDETSHVPAAIKGANNVEADRDGPKLLFYSQSGDLKMVKRLLDKCPNLNINYQDGFGWTALMCAAVSGHTDVVDCLMKRGADKFICNYQNKTASDLTKVTGCKSMKDRIDKFLNTTDIEDTVQPDAFFCDICQTKFQETTLKEHQTSTLHLFNMNLKPKTETYMIPKSNIGYRLMKRVGWDGEKGLGPEGKGQRLPVKTVLKRDRLCLGSKSDSKKKITHFGPYDKKATVSVSRTSRRVMSAATISRRERRMREKREKEKERNLRQSLDF